MAQPRGAAARRENMYGKKNHIWEEKKINYH
eukprot:COSAG06_NODE_842_length_11986_cov_54.409355_8_plen_31_part_00